MRAVSLLIALFACERGPILENDPDVVWFRSDRRIPEAAAAQIVADLRGRTEWWAGPIYVFSSSQRGDRFVVGHQRVHLREYEVTVGSFRRVEAGDDEAMACEEIGGLLAKLSWYAAELGIEWQARLGGAHGRIPGSMDAIRQAACRAARPADVAAILGRYADRPR